MCKDRQTQKKDSMSSPDLVCVDVFQFVSLTCHRVITNSGAGHHQPRQLWDADTVTCGAYWPALLAVKHPPKPITTATEAATTGKTTAVTVIMTVAKAGNDSSNSINGSRRAICVSVCPFISDGVAGVSQVDGGKYGHAGTAGALPCA